MQKMKRHDFSLAIIRVLDFVALISLVCTAIFNLLFNIDYFVYNTTFYIVVNSLVLVLCTTSVIFAVCNHFVKKKLHWLELGVAVATIVMAIVMVIVAKVGFDGASIQRESFMAAATLLLEVFATATTLAGTKLALIMSVKKDEKEQKPQPEQINQ